MTLDDDLAEEELDRLAQEGTDEDRRAVAKHPNTSLKTLLSLANAGLADEVDRNPMLLLHMEGGSDEVVEILMRIAEQTQRTERLQELASSSWNDVRIYVARNPSTPPALLPLLAKDKYVRRGVAMNANVTPDTLSLLSKDQDRYVRQRVACNWNTPPAHLSVLAKDQDDEVRRGVADNKNTPPDTLSLLAKDKDWYVRSGVARNANTPPDTLSILTKDKEVCVREVAKWTFDIIKKASR